MTIHSEGKCITGMMIRWGDRCYEAGGDEKMISEISDDLLDELSRIDPALWSDFNSVDLSSLIEEAKEAWLQYCLQEAIGERGWFFLLDGNGEEFIADITIFDMVCDIIDGDWANSSTEALLKAYIKAVKVVEGCD